MAARVTRLWEYVFAVSIARANMNRSPRRIAWWATRTCRSSIARPAQDRGPGGPDEGSQFELDDRRALDQPGQRGPAARWRPARIGHVARHEQMTAEWRRVEYPIEAVQKLMQQAGLPKRLVARLSHGL